MKKKITISVVLITILTIVFVLFTAEKTSKEKKELRQKRFERYSDAVNISGDFVIEGDKIIINNKEYNEINLIKEVAIYNIFFKDDMVELDELLMEFEKFCDGKEQSELLDKYQDRMRDITTRCENVGIFIRGYDYSRYAYYYLEEIYGEPLEFDELTIVDWKNAYAYASEKIYKEVLELEKNSESNR